MTPMSLFVTACLAISLSATIDPFSCGPFLLRPGTHTMTIVVDHHSLVPAELHYGIAGQAELGRVRHAAARRHHVFALVDLQPGTRYWYEVSAGSKLASGRHHFRTLPNQPASYRLIVLGDVRTLPSRWGAIATRVLRDEHDALSIIGTGDYPSNGRNYGQWVREFFAPARDLLAELPIWPVIGNHELTRPHDDLTGPELSKFFSLFELPGNERWYRVDGYLHTLLILDSNSHMGPGTQQYAWLRKQLRSERRRFTLVAFHHAPYTSGPHGTTLPDGTAREWPIDEARRFLVPLFEMYGVDLVLNGHDHMYERSTKAGIPYVVTGGGGAPLYRINSVPNPYQIKAASVHHYVRLNFAPGGIDLTTIDVAGKIIDRARFAVRADNLARRRHFIQARIKAGFVARRASSKPGTVELTITNPLTQTLSTEFVAGNRAPVSLVLKAGASNRLEIPFAKLARAAARKPWDPPMRIGIRASAKGRDAALALDFRWRGRLPLDEAVYPVTTLTANDVDGKDEEWGQVPPVALTDQAFMPIGRGNYHGDDDASANLRIARTKTHLLLYVKVRDDSVQDDGTQWLRTADSLHLLFSNAQGSLPRVQTLALGAGGRALWNGRAVGAIQCVAIRTTQGYAIEAAIPLTVLGTTGLPQRFDLVLIDQDAKERGPTLLRLYARSPFARDTRAFGTLRSIP